MEDPDDPRVALVTRLLDALADPALSPSERARLEQQLDRAGEVLDSGLAGFFHRMKSRQGTTMPDFEALHRRKADIDRRLGT